MTVDHAVNDVFEPGSVFKVVTIGRALSEHKITPRTAFTLPYKIQVADRVIHDAEIRPTERMTVAQILQRSSNVGDGHDRRAVSRRDRPEEVDGAVRIRPTDPGRLPG